MKKLLSLILVVIMLVTSMPIAMAEGDTYKVGDIIQFGSYPQSEVTDSEIIAVLNADDSDWESYNYYSGTGNWKDGEMVASDYMRYKDVNYGSNKYRGVVFDSYRPTHTGHISSSINSNQYDNGYNFGQVYWFKYEPIEWCILDPTTGMVISEIILDSQPYNNYILAGTNENGQGVLWGDPLKNYYANNYAESSIRKWLNNDFYNTAFSSKQKNIIKSTPINDTEQVSQINDKIFIVSSDIALDFLEYVSLLTKGSDYAKSQGLYVYSGSFKGTSPWLTRSLDLIDSGSCSGLDLDHAGRCHVCLTNKGIRPALRLKELSGTNNIYNLGEETYSFGNYTKCDCSGNGYGHCFGMSATSSGYYIGHLNKSIVGLTGNEIVYSLEENQDVKKPICYYQSIQGSERDDSIVAGGTYYKYWPFYNAKSDWEDIVDYVKNHEHDGKGDLIIGYKKKSEGNHAVNFLRYEVVNGQERIYVYDNNCPDKETYFYQDANDYIRQAVYSTFSGSIDCIALVDVNKFFRLAGSFVTAKVFQAPANAISVDGAYVTPMWGGDTENEIMIYQILEDETEVKITPLIDNATFTYMGEEYSFGKIDEDTYAEFTLSTSEYDTPEFEIINEPTDEPEVSEEPCTCKCHGNFIQRIIFKLINFFQKLFGKNKVCACGVKH